MVISIVVGLILLVLVGGALAYWARKNERWCFAVRGVARPGGGDPNRDPNLEAPLNEVEPSERPIIKAKPRPNT